MSDKDKLRQHGRVMPIIGAMLDTWNGLRDEYKQEIRAASPSLVVHIEKLQARIDLEDVDEE